MERFIADLVRDFEAGHVSRRQFCETVAVAATVYAAGEAAANAAPAQGMKAIAINHISYACPDYRPARDFYRDTFGMEVVPKSDNGKQAHLHFGPGLGQGGTSLIVRNGKTESNAKATVDHICYTISNWDEAKIRAALSAKGYDHPTGRPGSLHIYDPYDYDVQFANAVEEAAFHH
jgi:catechol 2,3-dioxygenase-like lactoylglutathione lyase family enzyme